MPTYQYACTACGHRFEAVQSFSDSSLTDCPECAGRLRKLFNTVGIVFKGSGFYRTDSRSGTPAASGSGSADGASSPDTAPKVPAAGASGTAAKEPAATNSGKDSGKGSTAPAA